MPSSFRALLSILFWSPHRDRRPRRRRFRPLLEFLELRATPTASTTWTGANHNTDSNWSDAGNWTNGVPGPGVIAVLTSNSVNKAVISTNSTDDIGSLSVAGLQIDGTWGATLTVNGALTLNGTAASEWDSGNIVVSQASGTLANNGTLTLNGSNNVTLAGGGTLTNNGAIVQKNSGNLNVTNTGNYDSTLANTGTYDFTADSNVTGGSGGVVTNSGTIEKTAGTGTSYITPPITSSGGTFDAETGTLQLAANTNDTNGTFRAAAGAALDLTGGNTLVENGSFTGAGSSVTAGSYGTLELSNGYVEAGTSGATFTVAGGLTYNWTGGTFYVPHGATLTYNGNLLLTNSSSNVNLGGGGTFTLNGTITQSGTKDLNLYSVNGAATTLNILAGSSYDITANSSIDGGGNGAVIDAGTIEKTGGTGTSVFSPPLTNNGGTVDAETGTLQLQTNTSDNSGIYRAAALAALDLTGGDNFTEYGTFTGTGSSVTAGSFGTLALTSGYLYAGTTGATFNVTSGLTFNWSGGNVYVPHGATLTYNGALLLTNSNSDDNLGGGGTFTLNGTITQSGAKDLNLYPVNSDATTLDVAPGSTYDFTTDSNIVGSGGGAVINTGTIEKTGGVATSSINPAFSNTPGSSGGVLTVQAGTLQLAPAGGTSTGGTFDVAPGTFLDLTGGQTANYSGNYTASGGGAVGFAGGTLNFPATSTFTALSGTPFQWNGGNLDIATGATLDFKGTMTVACVNQEIFGGGTLTNDGTINLAGTQNLYVAGSNSNVPSTLANNADGTIDFVADTGLLNGGGGGGTLTNQGLIEKTGGASTSYLGPTFNNSAAITVNTGSSPGGTLVLEPAGGTSTGGTFTVAATDVLDLTGGQTVSYAGTYTGTGAGQVQLNSGTLVVAGGAGGATFNFAKGLFRWNGGTINTNNNTLTLLSGLLITSSGNGSGGTVNELLTGGGTLSVGSATVASTFTDSGSGNNLSIGSGTTLSISAKGTLNLTNDDNLLGAGTVVNAGTFEKTGGTSTSTIQPAFDDSNGTTNGKVSVTRGTLSFTGPVNQVSNGHLTAGSWSVTNTTMVAALVLPGSISVIDPGVSVTLSGPYASFSNLSGLTSNNGSLSLLGTVLTLTGGFTNTGTLTVQVSYSTSGSQAGEIVTGSGGTVSLGGKLVVTGKGTPPGGSNFTLIDDGNSGDPIRGTFSTATLPAGYQLLSNAGDGNDLVLHKT
jgi:hypothetical protein